MDIILLSFAALITSAISAVLGMAGGIILLGIMAIIIPYGYEVIALHGIIQLISNVTRSVLFRKHIKYRIITQYLPGSILGLILSAIIILLITNFSQVDNASNLRVDYLKPIIGLFILWFLFGKRYKVRTQQPHFFGVGALSGIFTVFIGATGPLIAPFFLKGNLTKQNIIANKAVCQAISHLGKIPLFIYFFEFKYYNELNILIPLIIAVFIGTNLGKRILSFIPEQIFRLLFKIVLTSIAIKLIIDQLLIY